MIDLHAHILPGVDDGVRTIEEALDVIAAAASEGVKAIAATPHVREDYPTTPEQMERGVFELRAAVSAAGLPVQILHGAELEFARLGELSHDELHRFSLAQTGKYILVEFPYRAWPFGLESTVRALRSNRVTPILAHPERNPVVQDDPKRLASAVDAGALVQCTAASVDGRLGPAARMAVQDLLDLGLVHLLGTDDHGFHLGRGGLAAAARSFADEALAHRLTKEAPAAIVAGRPYPPRSA